MSIIVATGVYALLLKFLQKNSPHTGFLNNVQKTALFLRDGFPYLQYRNDIKDLVIEALPPSQCCRLEPSIPKQSSADLVHNTSTMVGMTAKFLMPFLQKVK